MLQSFMTHRREKTKTILKLSDKRLKILRLFENRKCLARNTPNLRHFLKSLIIRVLPYFKLATPDFGFRTVPPLDSDDTVIKLYPPCD